MTKVVLVEAHPLIRLGLHQLLGAMAGSWDVLALDARSIGEFAYLDCDVELVILGMAAEPSLSWQTLGEVERILHPRRTLLLSEPATTWQPPSGANFNSVYGCISRTAPVEVVEAAIRLGMAGEHVVTARNAPAVTAVGKGPAPWPAPPVATPEPNRWQPQPVHVNGASSFDDPELPAPAPAATSASARGALDPVAGAQLLNVTPRQYEVLTLLARGYPIKTVSRMLNISTATAKAHASTLYQRLRVNSKGEAVYAARQRGVFFD